MTSTTYVGAIPVTSVTCPSWCAVPQKAHLADLWNLEGRCVHWSGGRADSSLNWSVEHALTTYVDGTPNDEPLIHPDAPNEMTLPQAEEYARAILAAVEEARA